MWNQIKHTYLTSTYRSLPGSEESERSLLADSFDREDTPPAGQTPYVAPLCVGAGPPPLRRQNKADKTASVNKTQAVPDVEDAARDLLVIMALEATRLCKAGAPDAACRWEEIIRFSAKQKIPLHEIVVYTQKKDDLNMFSRFFSPKITLIEEVLNSDHFESLKLLTKNLESGVYADKRVTVDKDQAIRATGNGNNDERLFKFIEVGGQEKILTGCKLASGRSEGLIRDRDTFCVEGWLDAT